MGEFFEIKKTTISPSIFGESKFDFKKDRDITIHNDE
jgi:hypothetical protein